MKRFYKFIEIGYLIIFVVMLIEGVLHFNSERQKSYIFFIFAGMALFSFFFKKRFRKRFEDRRNKDEK